MKKNTLLAAALILTSSVFAQNSFVNSSTHHKTGNISALRSTRSMAASIVATNTYVAGTTMDLTFDLNLSSPDFEYGDSLSMTFPAGITINSASDPITPSTEGQPAEALNQPIVSPVVSWGDNDNNYGGIEPGTHSFFVNVTIPAGQTGPITINWFLDGDEYGAAPNFTQGTTTINPLPSVPDLALVAESDNKYYSIPASMPVAINYSAELTNSGSTLSAATNAVVSIPGTSYSETTAVSVPFATGANQSVSWNAANITTPGMYDVFFDVANTGDFNPDDNKDTLSLVISDSVYSYMDTITDGTFGIGDGSDGILGSIFDIPTTTDLSSISFYSPSSDPTASVSFVVYEVDANGPTNVLVFESDTFPTTATVPNTYVRAAGISLTGGSRYFIGIRESVAGNMSVGQSAIAYHPDSHYAYFQGAWMEVGGAGFLMGFAINANFNTGCQADFTYATDPADSMTIAFTNTSMYSGPGTMVSNWDFGDGSGTANIANPTYTYTAEGTFNTCLTISDGANCSNTKCINVTIDDGINGVSEIPANALSVYPNPTNGIVHVAYNKTAEVSVYSMDGSKVKVVTTGAGTSNVDLSELPKGTYLLKVSSEEGVSIKRISLMK